jgi:hypothetical protein
VASKMKRYRSVSSGQIEQPAPESIGTIRFRSIYKQPRYA